MLTKKYKNGFITLDAGMFPSVAQETIDREITDEFKSPTPIDDKTVDWTLKIATVAHPKDRQRSMSHLFFYILRSGK